MVGRGGTFRVTFGSFCLNFLFSFSVSRGPDCKNVNDDLFDQNFGVDDDHNEIYDDVCNKTTIHF